MSEARTTFEEQGYLGPLPVFSPEQCRDIMRRFEATPPPAPPHWSKGNAASSRLFYELATHPAVLDRVQELLGPDVLLWGAALVRRAPGRIHPWHSDIETSSDEGRTVSVWVGMEHTTPESSLHLLTHSHRFGSTIQQVAQERGKKRGEVGEEELEAWAREIDPESRLLKPEMTNGQGIWFDGRLWHGTRNLNPEGVRVALLLQFASAETPIRIPDPEVLEWPFRFLDQPLPPCVLVRGSSTGDRNRVVDPPPPSDAHSVPAHSWIHQFELPLAENRETGWGRHRVFRGPTAAAQELNCHASVLSGNRTPHELHAHAEEEVLVMLSGELEVALAPPEGEGTATRRTLRPGSMVYYAAGQRHTVRNAHGDPATYLMFKWHGPSRSVPQALTTCFFDFGVTPDADRAAGRRSRQVFAAQTEYLAGLHCHTTTLAPGAGYLPHADAYDVAVLVLEGEVQTLGRRVGPHGVVFYAAGEPHGMKNPGTRPARYLVLEFHPVGGPRTVARGRAKRQRNVILRVLRKTPIIWRLVPSGKRS